MKTKTFLVLVGLATTQSMFNSCGEDSNNLQNESYQGTSKVITELPSSLVSVQNYFENPEPYNGAVNFIKSHVLAQGPSYILTQDDLNLFYAKAQIPPNSRLTLAQVNQLINKTTNSFQVPFNEIIQQINISDAAKSLMLSINSNSISNIDGNSIFKNLPSNEKMIVKNFNDLQFNIEQGTILGGSTFSKEMGPGAQNGARIGFVIGCVLSGATANPAWVCAGSIIGGAIGSLWDK